MNTEQCGSTPNTTTTDFTNRGRRGYADLMDTARWPYFYSVKTTKTDCREFSIFLYIIAHMAQPWFKNHTTLPHIWPGFGLKIIPPYPGTHDPAFVLKSYHAHYPTHEPALVLKSYHPTPHMNQP